MKRLSLIAFLLVAGTISALAQGNTVVGKWKLSTFSTDGLTVNVDNPAETKKLLADQLKKATGSEPDSAQLEMMYNMVVPMFSSMSLEFTDKGKAIFNIPGPDGKVASETGTYEIDNSKGTLSTVFKKEDGTEKKETLKFSFDSGLLVVENGDKGEITRLKRVN